MSSTVLAVDCGQSGSRARVVAPDGRAGSPDIDLPAIRTDLPVLPQLASHVATVAADHHFDAIAMGVTGLTDDDTADDLLELVRDTGVTTVYLAHDSITSYLTALGAAPGVVVASGTGVVTLAVGKDKLARVDGWGFIMGDLGSGYWIGQQGLMAGMKHFDGRGPATRMLDVIREQIDPEPPDAYITLQADEDRVSRVASFAKTVLDLAENGDEPCREIAFRAASELATSATTGLRLVGETTAPTACGLGGIFRSPLLAGYFTAAMRQSFDDAVVVPPKGVGLDGAYLLSTIPADHPLRDRIGFARA